MNIRDIKMMIALMGVSCVLSLIIYRIHEENEGRYKRIGEIYEEEIGILSEEKTAYEEGLTVKRDGVIYIYEGGPESYEGTDIVEPLKVEAEEAERRIVNLEERIKYLEDKMEGESRRNIVNRIPGMADAEREEGILIIYTGVLGVLSLMVSIGAVIWGMISDRPYETKRAAVVSLVVGLLSIGVLLGILYRG